MTIIKTLKKMMRIRMINRDNYKERLVFSVVGTIVAGIALGITRSVVFVGIPRVKTWMRRRNKIAKTIKQIEEAQVSGKFDLRGYEIRDTEAKVLGAAIKKAQASVTLYLRHIDLGDNRIGVEGVRALSEVLQSGKCPNGFHLDLICNHIGDKGARALAQVLESGNCPDGLYIDFGCNHIGVKGTQALAQALQSGNCPVGLHVGLSGNHIGYEGAQALAQALQSGNCPPELHMDLSNDRSMYIEGVEALEQAFQSGNCPPGFRINDNCIGVEEAQTTTLIQECLDRSIKNPKRFISDVGYSVIKAQNGYNIAKGTDLILPAELAQEPPGIQYSLRWLHNRENPHPATENADNDFVPAALEMN